MNTQSRVNLTAHHKKDLLKQLLVNTPSLWCSAQTKNKTPRSFTKAADLIINDQETALVATHQQNKHWGNLNERHLTKFITYYGHVLPISKGTTMLKILMCAQPCIHNMKYAVSLQLQVPICPNWYRPFAAKMKSKFAKFLFFCYFEKQDCSSFKLQKKSFELTMFLVNMQYNYGWKKNKGIFLRLCNKGDNS